MARFKFNIQVTKDNTQKFSNAARESVRKSIRTVAQDLTRTSSGATPRLEGDLEEGFSVGYSGAANRYVATVEYAVYNGGFNYAIAMHEWSYTLGDKSLAKGGGTGMSGRTYSVGRKYLTRVLEGESEAYKEYISNQLKRVLRG